MSKTDTLAKPEVAKQVAAGLAASVLYSAPAPDDRQALMPQEISIRNEAVRHAAMTDEDGQVIYIDTCKPDSTDAYEIRSTGISVNPDPPVIFVRPVGTRALPKHSDDPAKRTAAIVKLQKLTRLDDKDFTIFLIYILSCYAPSPKRFLLSLGGVAGSGKTELARLVKSIIDPTDDPEVTKPSDRAAFYSAAKHCYLLTIDNVSNAGSWYSDALCTLLTGASDTVRALYTNNEVCRFRETRPVIMTSISDMVWRGDPASRTLNIHLPLLTEDDALSDTEIASIVKEIEAGLLGAFLNAVAHALKNPSVGIVKHRQQDLVDFTVAGAPRLGLSLNGIQEAMREVNESLQESVLEASPLAEPLKRLGSALYERGAVEKFFTSTNLLSELTALARDERSDKFWPDNPRQLTAKLLNIRQSLLNIGIELNKEKRRAGRGWIVNIAGYEPEEVYVRPTMSVASYERNQKDMEKAALDEKKKEEKREAKDAKQTEKLTNLPRSGK